MFVQQLKTKHKNILHSGNVMVWCEGINTIFYMQVNVILINNSELLIYNATCDFIYRSIHLEPAWTNGPENTANTFSSSVSARTTLKIK